MPSPPLFPEFSWRTRERFLKELKSRPLDLLIIGGGIVGAGIVRDAALRGLRVGLIEKKDFGYGTSSRSSKLIHGGLRYLEMMEFRLVFEACAERKVLREIAPHLVRPLPFAVPVYKDSKLKPWMLNFGLTMYDVLSLFRSPKLHKNFSATEFARLDPPLKHPRLVGGSIYYDAMTDDARLTLESIRSGAYHGGFPVNYAACGGEIVKEGDLFTVLVTDMISGESFPVQSYSVVNATGPWTDAVRKLCGNGEPRIRPTKGIHIVVPRAKAPVVHASVLNAVQDGRVMFIIPWGDFSIIGTTDTDYQESLDDLAATRSDVEYLLETANYYLPEAILSPADVVSTWAGVRPLLFEEGKSESQVSREHALFFEPNGVLTIAGGKLTTYRRMAREVLDTLRKAVGGTVAEKLRSPCLTGSLTLHGEAVEVGGAEWDEPPGSVSGVMGREDRLETYGKYGALVGERWEAAPESKKPLLEGLPYSVAELEHALNYEMTLKPDDFLVRRTQAILQDSNQALGALPKVADIMGKALGWTEEQKAEASKDFEEEATRRSRWKR